MKGKRVYFCLLFFVFVLTACGISSDGGEQEDETVIYEAGSGEGLFHEIARERKYNPQSVFGDMDFARELLKEIIRALDEEDNEALRSLFSENAKINFDLKKQIAEAMEYYQGRCITEWEDPSSWGSSETHRKNRKYLYRELMFMLYDIETDADKVYHLEVYCDVISEYPDALGISRIIFKKPETKNGVEFAIGQKMNNQ